MGRRPYILTTFTGLLDSTQKKSHIRWVLSIFMLSVLTFSSHQSMGISPMMGTSIHHALISTITMTPEGIPNVREIKIPKSIYDSDEPIRKAIQEAKDQYALEKEALIKAHTVELEMMLNGSYTHQELGNEKKYYKDKAQKHRKNADDLVKGIENRIKKIQDSEWLVEKLKKIGVKTKAKATFGEGESGQKDSVDEQSIGADQTVTFQTNSSKGKRKRECQKFPQGVEGEALHAIADVYAERRGSGEIIRETDPGFEERENFILCDPFGQLEHGKGPLKPNSVYNFVMYEKSKGVLDFAKSLDIPHKYCVTFLTDENGNPGKRIKSKKGGKHEEGGKNLGTRVMGFMLGKTGRRAYAYWVPIQLSKELPLVWLPIGGQCNAEVNAGINIFLDDEAPQDILAVRIASKDGRPIIERFGNHLIANDPSERASSLLSVLANVSKKSYLDTFNEPVKDMLKIAKSAAGHIASELTGGLEQYKDDPLVGQP